MQGLSLRTADICSILKALEKSLDRNWWYVGGAGMSFPEVKEAKRLPPEPRLPIKKGHGKDKRVSPAVGPLDPVDWKRYQHDYDSAVEEYSRWIEQTECGDVIGKLGFFSRYAKGLNTDWNIYFSSDSNELPYASFQTAYDRCDGNWFDSLPELSSDIYLAVRTIDFALADVFLRDQRVFDTLWADLERRGMTPTIYTPRRT